MEVTQLAPTAPQVQQAAAAAAVAAHSSYPWPIQDTIESLSVPVAPTAPAAPKSLFFRVLDWAKIKLWGEDAEADLVDEAAMWDDCLTSPVGKTEDAELVAELQVLLDKSKNIDEEKEETQQVASQDFIQKILLQVLMNRIKGINEDRIISAKTHLQNSEEGTKLQKNRIEHSKSIREIDANHKLWSNVVWLTTAAGVVFGLGSMVMASTTAGTAIKVTLAFSSCAAGIMSARAKQSSQELQGKNLENNNLIQQNNDRMAVAEKFFGDSFQEHGKFFKLTRRALMEEDHVTKLFTQPKN